MGGNRIATNHRACKERKTESYEISGFGKGISRG